MEKEQKQEVKMEDVYEKRMQEVDEKKQEFLDAKELKGELWMAKKGMNETGLTLGLQQGFFSKEQLVDAIAAVAENEQNEAKLFVPYEILVQLIPQQKDRDKFYKDLKKSLKNKKKVDLPLYEAEQSELALNLYKELDEADVAGYFLADSPIIQNGYRKMIVKLMRAKSGYIPEYTSMDECGAAYTAIGEKGFDILEKGRAKVREQEEGYQQILEDVHNELLAKVVKIRSVIIEENAANLASIMRALDTYPKFEEIKDEKELKEVTGWVEALSAEGQQMIEAQESRFKEQSEPYYAAIQSIREKMMGLTVMNLRYRFGKDDGIWHKGIGRYESHGPVLNPRTAA